MAHRPRPFIRLPLKHRAALILYIGGLTQREIGLLFKVPQQSVCYWIKRGYDEIRHETNIEKWVKRIFR